MGAGNRCHKALQNVGVCGGRCRDVSGASDVGGGADECTSSGGEDAAFGIVENRASLCIAQIESRLLSQRTEIDFRKSTFVLL